MFAPLLSEVDPKQSEEGAINPLGTYSIADALAVQVAPGIRERQFRPRFLSVMAVSFAVCNAFDEERVAADEVSEPWQVFEWYVVEGLVRGLGGTGRLSRVPGSEKVAAAVRNNIPLCASQYLKTPRVFGFHGVYRTLARELHVEDLDCIGETGRDILAVWAEEQALDGFFDSTGGPGYQARRLLVEAVDDGLSNGRTCRGPGWEGWKFIAKHLAPDPKAMGKKESKALVRALFRDDEGFRRPVMEFLASPEGQAVLAERHEDGSISERTFHKGLRRVANAALRNLLDTVQVYERFSRLLQDAFDDCLYEMSPGTRVSPRNLGTCKNVVSAAEKVPDLFAELLEMLSPYGLAPRLQETFLNVSERQTPETWAASLLEHHRRIQREKPPHGKAPWFERCDDGTYAIYPAYRRDTPGARSTEYVHFYRTNPLDRFVCDLGMVK
jgi:hypothetical protein